MPKFDLSKTGILTDEDWKQFKTADEIVDQVDAEISKLGLERYPKPSTQPPDLTAFDVAEIPNNQLGQLYSQYTAHAQFVFGEFVRAEAHYKAGVAALKHVEAVMKTKLFAQEVPKAEVPARVKEDPLRVQYEVEVLTLFARREILEAYYKQFSKSADMLSRIIALRELEFNQQMREMGIQGRRKGPAQRPQHDFSRAPGKGGG